MSDTAWVSQLPEHALWELLDGLSGSEGIVIKGELYQAILDHLWNSRSHAMSEWPTGYTNTTPARAFVKYCSKAKNGPDDPDHQPGRRMVTPDYRQIYSCSCGVRDNDARIVSRVERKQRIPGPLNWPTEQINGVTHYLVCPMAPSADDLDHMLAVVPWQGAYACICNCTYKRDDDGLYKAAKVMPAQ